MSCKNCIRMEEQLAGFYYRWKTARIKITACHDHAKEIIQALDEKQENENQRHQKETTEKAQE